MSNETKPLLSDEHINNIAADLCVHPDKNGEPDWDPSVVQSCVDGSKKVRDLYEADRSKLMAVLQVCADAIENSRVELCSAIPHLPTVGVNLATAREKECRDALSQLKAIGVEPNK